MEDRTNTIFGWVLFSGIIALGLSSVSSHYFRADKPHAPHEAGYVIEGGEEDDAAAEIPLATYLSQADAAAGEAIFAKCKSCHTIDAGGANGIGPNLHGTMGKEVAHHAGFDYSDGLKALGGTWTWEKMNDWLKSPKGLVGGTKMTFAGLGKPEDRAALMLYLNQQGAGMPLPEVPVADEAPAELEEAAAGEAPTEPEAAATDAPAEAAAAE